MQLGEVDVSAQDMEAQAHEWVKARQQRIEKAVSHLPQTTADRERQRSYPLALADYLNAMRRVEKLAREKRRGGDDEDTGETPPVLGLRDIVLRRGLSGLSADVNGWLNYLAELDARFMEIPKHAPVPQLTEETRQLHTHIVAATGQGKSTLMKALMHHYVRHPSAAVVLLDPQGDLARQVARWPEFVHAGERLAYYKPGLVPGYNFGLNPLALGRSLPPEQRNSYAKYMAHTLTELVPEAELTSNMLTLATFCTQALLERKGTTLRDMRDMLGDKNDPARARLVQLARTSRNDDVASFFRGPFEAENYKSSKPHLQNRLYTLLADKGFTDLVCADRCLNLASAITKRRFVLFDLSPLGPDGAAAIGRLVLMMLWGLAERRYQDSNLPRDPVHVFIDEAGMFAGEAVGYILNRARKVGVSLTLAQQVEGDNFTKDVRERIRTNTAIKLIGANDGGEVARALGYKPAALGRLNKGEFWCRWGQENDLVKLKVRSDLADDKHAMSERDWAALVASWKGTIYKPLEAPRQREAKPVNDYPLD